ncbi:LrgB family protein [Reinekea marinisedimentorum]|uniref:Putative murein hydrolase (TIGR00659 family) n=1 Tax=Reinekea marinisedimentorum TaxID=230495 RepID=A0A4R3I3K0_9GAMM|nr:LrgB family protein [Reinekea marinisedimentorum]TCS40405.1 putative murein hydrolase (TIGR00659 family) [Reinekea marinisedimentorum]
MNTSVEMLLAISLTMGIYLAAEKLYVRLKRSALVHPVVISIFSLMGILALFDWDYARYQQDTYLISFLLGPATVALAIPLYEQMSLIKQMALPLMVACLVGAVVAAGSAALLSAVWTGDEIISLSMISKSVTTPIGMDISRVVGGSPSLAAGIIMFAGMLGSLFVPYATKRLGVKNDAIHGFAVGVTAHGFGTAQAFERSVQAGAFAGLAMSLTGIISAFLLPVMPLADWVVQLTR